MQHGLKKTILTILGISTSGIPLLIIYITQGILINYWSGLDPYSRIYLIFMIIPFGMLFVMLDLIICKILKRKIIKLISYYKLGVIIGFISLIFVLAPWVDSDISKFLDLTIMAVIFIVSLLFVLKNSKVIIDDEGKTKKIDP